MKIHYKMAEKVTIETLNKRLIKIEKILLDVLKEEEVIEESQERIETDESKELSVLDRLHGTDIKKRFKNISQWKLKIWDNCPDKKYVEMNNFEDFLCKKTGKSCRFIDCYRNKVV